jgi:hypothetical protein
MTEPDINSIEITDADIRYLIARERLRRYLSAFDRDQLKAMMDDKDQQIDTIDQEMVQAKAEWEEVRHRIGSQRRELVMERDAMNEVYISGRSTTSIAVPSTELSLTSQGDTNGTPNS